MFGAFRSRNIKTLKRDYIMQNKPFARPIRLDIESLRDEAQAIQAALRCANVRECHVVHEIPVERPKTILL
jgi:hypothetical protein